ncbi:MAG: hypothetical protein H6564_06675 [Lewinellaceae bacterium]|nr:hypothetical protein [Lewinellaceae bacterium]
MRHRYLILILACFVALSTACRQNKEEQKGPQLFADLYVRYLQAEEELKATATFFEGDSIETASPKILTGGASFQGSGMEPRPLPGGTVRYTLQRNGDYAASFPFRFKNNNGLQQEYSLSMAPIDTFYIHGAKASKSQGMSAYADGGQLQAGESLVFLFSDAQNQAFSFTLNGPLATTEIKVPPSQLESLKPGPYQLYLVKKKRSTEVKPGLAVLANIEFYTRTVEVEVEE